MESFFSKKINLVRILLGLCALVNLCTIYLYGLDFLDPLGPLPEKWALILRHSTFLHFLPEVMLHLLPYWWGKAQLFSFVPHLLLLISFMIGLKSKLTIPLLFIFEYCLLVRMGVMVHGGHLLFLIMLLIFMVEDWLPENNKWWASTIWVSQFCLVYLFSGIYKSFDLWLLKGSALQLYLNLEALNNGRDAIQLGLVGPWFSRPVVPIEIICPSILILALLNLRIRSLIKIICLFLLVLIHTASFFLFSIFTFPFVGVVILLGIYIGLKKTEQKPLMPKLIIFSSVLIFHLLPLFKIDLPLPFKNQWTFFSRPPRVVGGTVEIRVIKNEQVVYRTMLDESFHWTRFRFTIDSAFPGYQNQRMAMTNFLCHKYDAARVVWDTPTGIKNYNCSTRN